MLRAVGISHCFKPPSVNATDNVAFGGAFEDALESGFGIFIASPSGVAMSWGISHLGRFSIKYRNHFGESPSAMCAAAWFRSARARNEKGERVARELTSARPRVCSLRRLAEGTRIQTRARKCVSWDPGHHARTHALPRRPAKLRFALHPGFDSGVDYLEFSESCFEIVAGNFVCEHLEDRGTSGSLKMGE